MESTQGASDRLASAALRQIVVVSAAADADDDGALGGAAEEPAPPLRLPPQALSPKSRPLMLASDFASGGGRAPPPPPPRRTLSWVLLNGVVLPPLLPLLAAYWLASLLLAWALALTVLPCRLLGARLMWALPFIGHIFEGGKNGGAAGRVLFEGAHTVTVLARVFTLPLRRRLPDFYIAGFAKCGTTTLAAYLKQHPAISGVAGPPGHEALSKESHYLAGVLGRRHASGAALYRSFFPTLMTRWWREAARGARRWLVFDATPTYASLPHAAARAAALTPGARAVFIVRDPVDALFSAQAMLDAMGAPLGWSLTDELPAGSAAAAAAAAARFQESPADAAYWAALEALPPGAPLPADLPRRAYAELPGCVRAARYADRLEPWLRAFPPDRLLLVDFNDLVTAPRETVAAVLRFVGADPDMPGYAFERLAPRMKGAYKDGARVAPGVRAHLDRAAFGDSNARVARLLGAEFPAPRSRRAAAAAAAAAAPPAPPL